MNHILSSIADEFVLQFNKKSNCKDVAHYLLSPNVDVHNNFQELVKTVRLLAYTVPTEITEAINLITDTGYTVIIPEYTDEQLDDCMTRIEAMHVIKLARAVRVLDPKSLTGFYRVLSISEYPHG